MIVVNITGASGVILGVRLVEELLGSGQKVGAIVSGAAKKVISHEIPGAKNFTTLKALLLSRNPKVKAGRLREYAEDDLCADIASGSCPFRAVAVVPCSMKSLAGFACGYADSLIGRTVDVALKENRQCVLVPRETPLNLIHLENLVKMKRAGADIVMPVPGFYTRPQSVDDVVDYVVGKILNLLGIRHRLFKPWGD